MLFYKDYVKYGVMPPTKGIDMLSSAAVLKLQCQGAARTWGSCADRRLVS